MFSQRALEIQLRKILHVTVNISCRWVTFEYNCLFESSGLLIHTHWYWSNPVSGEGPNNSMPITMMTYPRTIRGTLSAYNTIYNRKINIFKDTIEESKWFCNACCKIWIDFSFWKLVVSIVNFDISDLLHVLEKERKKLLTNLSDMYPTIGDDIV